MDPAPDDSVVLCQACGQTTGKGTSKWAGNSLLVQRLRENPIPLQDEATHAQSEITDASNALGLVDTEIAKLTKSLEALQTRRQDISSFISQKKSVIAPVRRLPVELLAEIMLYACTDSCFGYRKDSHHHPTLRISQTCHLWRTLCLSSPILWSDIGIIVFCGPNEDYGADEFSDDSEVLDIYLRRSLSHPLQVYIDGPSDLEWCYGKDDISWADKRMITRLGSESHRWESAIVRVEAVPFISSRFLDDAREMPNLASLTLRGNLWSSYDRHDSHKDIFSSCRQLQDVEFEGIDLNEFAMPMDLVRVVELVNCSASDLPLLCERAPNMNTLRLTDRDDPDMGLEDYLMDLTRSVSIPTLETLSVCDASSHYKGPTAAIFGNLLAPSLRELVVRGWSWDAEKALSDLYSSNMRLPLLRVFSLCDPEADIVKVVQGLRHLEEISNLDLDFSNNFINCKTPSEGSVSFLFQSLSGMDALGVSQAPKLIPSLESFSLVVCRLAIDNAVIEFLESRRRMKSSARLKEVHLSRSIRKASRRDISLSTDPPVKGAPPHEIVCADQEILGRLKALQQDGLKLVINGDKDPLPKLRCLM